MENKLGPDGNHHVFRTTIANNHVFTGMLAEFARIRAMPIPPTNALAWLVWNVTVIKSRTALVSVIDYYCAKCALAVVLVILKERKREEAKASE